MAVPVEDPMGTDRDPLYRVVSQHDPLEATMSTMPSPLGMASVLLNTPLPDLSGEHWAKPVPPETHRFVADIDTLLEQEIFDLPQ